MEFKYKQIKTLDQRKLISHNIMEKNPDKVPIILEKDPTNKIQEFNKTKFLSDKKYTVAQFTLKIRSEMKLPEEEALFLSVKGKYSISGQKIMENVYNTYKDEDGFLYIMYTSELIYGNKI